MPDLENYAERYGAQYADKTFETILVSVRLREVVSHLIHYRPRSVLDVGCGLDPLFVHYDHFDTWRVIEPESPFVRRCREIAADDERIQVYEGYLEENTATLAETAYDFIVVSSLLHEVSDPLRLLREIRSLCSEKTIVHFNVPNVLSFHRLLALEMGLIGDIFEKSEMDRTFQRQTRFDEKGLADVLTHAGFRILDSGTYFVKPFTHHQMDALLRTDAFPPSLIDGLERMTKYMPQHGCEIYVNVQKT